MKKTFLSILILNLCLLAILEVAVYVYQTLEKPSREAQAEPDVLPPFYADLRSSCSEARIFDPNLHHTFSHNPDPRCKNPYGIYKNGAFQYEPLNRPLTLYALGGSTTDATVRSFSNYQTWAYFVAHHKKAPADMSVINGGVAGYGSGQELIKFIRDGLPLKPQIVISLNGINENYTGNDWYHFMPYAPSSKGDFELGQVRKKLVEKTFLPKVKLLIEKALEKAVAASTPAVSDMTLSYLKDTGFFYDYSAVPADEVWLQNVEALHDVVTGYGGTYIVFVQPTLALAGTEPEKNSPDWEMMNSLDAKYKDSINALYEKLREKCARLDYCVDLSGILTGSKDLYHDPRHPNSEGNQILADEIVKAIHSHWRPSAP